MNVSHDLFLLMFTLSQMRDKDKIIRFFQESINELFQPHDFLYSEEIIDDSAYLEKIATRNFNYGYILSSALLSEETKKLVQNAVQMLAVLLDRLRIENELSEKANSMENIAQQRLNEINSYVDELEKAKLASLNLIDDLKDEIAIRRKVEEEVNRLNQELELRVIQRTAQLEYTNKELESFVYSISHDLRAPLRSIMGFSEIISHRHKDNLNEEGLKYFDYILEAGTNMANLIEDLLKFSRLVKGSVIKEDINLNEILEYALKNLNQDIKEGNAKINIPNNLPVVKGDSALLGQIFTNLIQNAIVYHRNGINPEITFLAEENENNFIIKIKDNGQGIPKEHHEKIFNIFQRLHANDEFPGTGIGLAIVKKAVEALGGSISIESDVGKGSTFSVHLSKN